MKTKISSAAFLVILVLSFSGQLVAQTTTGKGPMGQMLDRLNDYNKALSSLQANVSMVKTDAALGTSETIVGTTSFLPKKNGHDRYARIDWTKPITESIVVIGDKYRLYRPRLNQIIVGVTDGAKNSASVGGALSFVTMNKEQLKANFEVAFLNTETVGDKQAWHLRLTPKNKVSYKLAEIWVDTDGLPRKAKIIENNNDSTTVTLSDIRANGKIDKNVFILNPAPGTKELKG